MQINKNAVLKKTLQSRGVVGRVVKCLNKQKQKKTTKKKEKKMRELEGERVARKLCSFYRH